MGGEIIYYALPLIDVLPIGMFLLPTGICRNLRVYKRGKKYFHYSNCCRYFGDYERLLPVSQWCGHRFSRKAAVYYIS
jgi:hypothetical protein